MTDTEMVEKAEAEQVEEKPEIEEIVETKEEEFDKERAMKTINNLRAYEKKATKLEKELEAYRQKEEDRKKAEMSEIDRLKLEAQEAKSKLAELTLKEQKREIAHKLNLPEALADRIKGENLEEMEADAKGLFDALPKPGASKSLVTNPGAQAVEPSSVQPRIDPFDAGFVRNHGGGLVEK
jgi:hypothetical protein